MSVKGEIKEATGFVKEELNEHGSRRRAKKKLRKVAIFATRVGWTMARRPRPRLPVPAIQKSSPSNNPAPAGLFITETGNPRNERAVSKHDKQCAQNRSQSNH